jgi:hypothetical protein
MLAVVFLAKASERFSTGLWRANRTLAVANDWLAATVEVWMERESFEDLPGCAETLVIKNLAFSCQLTRAHDGMHRCPADDEQGTEVEWPVAWPAGVREGLCASVQGWVWVTRFASAYLAGMRLGGDMFMALGGSVMQSAV